MKLKLKPKQTENEPALKPTQTDRDTKVYTRPIPDKIVSIATFCKMLGVNNGVWFQYYKRDKVFYCGETASGMKLIDFHAMLQNIREIAPNSKFYSDEAIIERRLRKGTITPEQANALRHGIKTKNLQNGIGSIINENGNEIEEPIDTDNEFSPQMTRREAETVKQVYQAKAAKLKFLKEMGAVTDTKLFMDHAIIMATAVQKACMSIPDRVSELYASMTEPSAIKEDLTKELTYALSKLKFDIEGIQDKSKLIDSDEKDILDAYDGETKTKN